MEKDQQARDRVQDVVRDLVKAEVEEEWAGLSQQDRVEKVSVQAVERQLLMLQDSLVMQKVVLNVVRK
jgi:hypothetical protein